MHRAFFLVALLSLVPAASLAMMGGGGYSGGMHGSATGGFDTGREDFVAAMRLIDNKDYAEAIFHLRRVLQVQQGNADILNDLGFCERMAGNYPDSLDYYLRALARNPDHKGAHEYLGELYLAMHQPDQAHTQLAELTRLCPDGCVEKDTLAQAIMKYEMAAPPGAAPPATPAAQSPAPSK